MRRVFVRKIVQEGKCEESGRRRGVNGADMRCVTGLLYEKSYKRGLVYGARPEFVRKIVQKVADIRLRREFVRKIVQKRGKVGCTAGVCTKNRTKGGVSEECGGVLYEKSYKTGLVCGARQGFVRKIVQKGVRAKRAGVGGGKRG
ncbi:hypothetical protein D3P08_13425 [Paenibacillus nanensis]|uniref:Uncharacterized protein n=1 Tax=Paenibacillus nanensis TaxID=393251 RepID=A0A3A1UV98_9BACL|nr:hypothetical protein D3P08_13425 [Paenibacillus nanensis]